MYLKKIDNFVWRLSYLIIIFWVISWLLGTFWLTVVYVKSWLKLTEVEQFLWANHFESVIINPNVDSNLSFEYSVTKFSHGLCTIEFNNFELRGLITFFVVFMCVCFPQRILRHFDVAAVTSLNVCSLFFSLPQMLSSQLQAFFFSI